MSTSPAGDVRRSALRQGVLVVCAVAALFTAVSTSLESQRTVARLTSPSTESSITAGASESKPSAAAESCRAR